MLFPILIFILIVFLFFVRIKQINEYEKGILFKFGKFTKELGAGWHFYVPLYQNITKVDTRTTVHDVPEQDAITKDNVSIKINAVVYYHVSDAKLTVLKVENVRYAVGQISQTTMRNIVGAYTLDELLSERDEISTKICTIIDKETDAWGIKVENVELKDIRLPEEMQRVLAKVAEAEREKAAVITKSKGEIESANNLAEAARVMSTTPGALHLRTLSTLNDISSDQSNTIVFAVPLEVLRAFDGTPEKVVETVKRMANKKEEE